MTNKHLPVAVIVAGCLVCSAGDGLAKAPGQAKAAPRYNPIPLARFAASIATAFSVQPPEQADRPIDGVCDEIRSLSGGRVVIYNPDAAAPWLIEKHQGMFKPLLAHAQIKLPMATMPVVTLAVGRLPATPLQRHDAVVTVNNASASAIKASLEFAIKPPVEVQRSMRQSVTVPAGGKAECRTVSYTHLRRRRCVCKSY